MTGPYGDLSSPALPGNTGAGSEKKRMTAVDQGTHWTCSECPTSSHSKKFRSRQAACGHMHVHTRLAKQQAEGRASSSAAEARRKKIHEDLDLNKKAPGVHEEQHEELARTSPNSVQKAEAESRKKKRKEEVPYASGMSQSCRLSGKQFKSHQACDGPMCVDNNQPQRQVQQEREEKEKELAGTLLKLEQCNLNKMKGDGSAMAEDGASLSAAEDAQRKQKHSNFDLNGPPADNKNDDEKGA